MAEIQRYFEKCIWTRLLEFKIKKIELQRVRIQDKKIELRRVNADGTYSNHCSLKGYHIRK